MKVSFISIILPIRNEEKCITKCLESAVNQDYGKSNYEILIIEGMSTDNTMTIIKRFMQKYDNIRLFNNPKMIAPTAMNIGISQAKGEVIIRLDGHSTFEKDYLSQCVKYLEKTESDCVGGVIKSINETTMGKAIALAMSCPFGVGNARFRTSGSEGYVDTLAFGAYRKEVFDKIGLFDEELVRAQDEEFNYRLRKAGGGIFFTPKIKSYYFPRANLKKLWRQYFGYGLWKIRVLQKHLKTMQLRHFIPALFIVSLIGSLVLGLLWKPMFWIFAFISIIYLLTSLAFSARISLKQGFKYFPILPIIFSTLHFSNGAGFLIGLVRFFRYWGKENQ
ncbi:glycosyltransferase family 2 protein [candidate division KSB1 bacterium]|nr:glycosyltransferase family 2 protein [candidate division KSB1 bacterium]